MATSWISSRLHTPSQEIYIDTTKSPSSPTSKIQWGKYQDLGCRGQSVFVSSLKDTQQMNSQAMIVKPGYASLWEVHAPTFHIGVIRKTIFEKYDSELQDLLAVCVWVGSWTRRCFTLLICKIEIKSQIQKGCKNQRTNCCNTVSSTQCREVAPMEPHQIVIETRPS